MKTDFNPETIALPPELEKKRIDPLGYLIQITEDLKLELADMRTRLELKSYSVKELAAGLGYSPQTLRNKPWKMPHFGRPDEGAHPGRWFYNTVIAWYRVPEEERRLKWETMSSLERRKYLGRA